jgi:hypothetical protein
VWHGYRLYYKYCLFVEAHCYCVEADHYGGTCWSVTCLLSLHIVQSFTPGKRYYVMSFFPDAAEAVSETEVCFNVTHISAQEDLNLVRAKLYSFHASL